METTLARFAATEAERDWKYHKAHCPQCSDAARSRCWTVLCPDGQDIRAAHVEAAADLKANRELDKLPSPDQEPLF
jgi:hypothetical protein